MSAIAALLVALAQGEAPKDPVPPVKTVTLAGEERSVHDLIEAIRKQTELTIECENLDENAKVRIEWKERPVLAALDDLCRELKAGSVRVEARPKEGARIVLDGSAALPHAASCEKQFRAEVTDVVVTLQKSLHSTQRSAHVAIAISAQPDVKPAAMSGFRVEEAIDNTGASLLSSRWSDHDREEFVEGVNPAVVVWVDSRFGRGRGVEGSLQVPLLAPAEGAKKIELLRGRVLMTFPQKSVDETVPVADLVKGKEIVIGPLKITVASFELQEGKATLVCQVSGKANERGFFSFPQFDPVDDRGESLAGGYSGSGSGASYTLAYTLRGKSPMTGLRYRCTIGQTTIAVPFEFKDIPIPQK